MELVQVGDMGRGSCYEGRAMHCAQAGVRMHSWQNTSQLLSVVCAGAGHPFTPPAHFCSCLCQWHAKLRMPWRHKHAPSVWNLCLILTRPFSCAPSRCALPGLPKPLVATRCLIVPSLATKERAESSPPGSNITVNVALCLLHRGRRVSTPRQEAHRRARTHARMHSHPHTCSPTQPSCLLQAPLPLPRPLPFPSPRPSPRRPPAPCLHTKPLQPSVRVRIHTVTSMLR